MFDSDRGALCTEQSSCPITDEQAGDKTEILGQNMRDLPSLAPAPEPFPSTIFHEVTKCRFLGLAGMPVMPKSNVLMHVWAHPPP